MKRHVSLVMLLTIVAVAAASAGWIYVRYWGKYGIGDGDFSNPSGVAVAPNKGGDVYVVDQRNNRIQYFTYNGTFLGKWGVYGSGNGQFNYPISVVVSDELVYVSDRGNHRVQYFTPAGSFQGQWGTEGTGNGQFKNPWGVAVAPNGTVYVADSSNDRVQYFTSVGSFLGTWGSTGSGDGQFHDPRGITVASGDNVYVTDVGNNRVQYFTSTGSFLGKWGAAGTAEGRFNLPSGIAFSEEAGPYEKLIFVADTGNDRVQYFNTNGSFIETWGESGSSAGSFNYPLDLAVAPKKVVHPQGGAVYVADTRNNRIQVFDWTDPSVEPSSFGKVKALFR
ncbi:MAG TPA: 6-bladed beta-propeller [bacterium]|nr:6-bladed beta-propeller [bacterium]